MTKFEASVYANVLRAERFLSVFRQREYGLTLRFIGEEMGISAERVRQILNEPYFTSITMPYES